MNNVTNNGVDLSVTINGRPARVYVQDGRYFIESRVDSEYFIEIKNSNYYRVEAVVAVDGLSVMNGEPASIEDHGYVIPAYGSIKIKGYRKNHEEVGAFKFSKKENSYAELDKGDGSNVGVIAVAIWKEKLAPIYFGTSVPLNQPAGFTWSGTPSGFYSGNQYTSTGSDYSQTVYASSVGQTLGSSLLRGTAVNCSVLDSNPITTTASFAHGTTWGQKIDDKVTTTTFQRDVILSNTNIFYNSKENLEAIGIKFIPEKLITLPTGFPRTFAIPPSGWKS